MQIDLRETTRTRVEGTTVGWSLMLDGNEYCDLTVEDMKQLRDVLSRALSDLPEPSNTDNL